MKTKGRRKKIHTNFILFMYLPRTLNQMQSRWRWIHCSVRRNGRFFLLVYLFASASFTLLPVSTILSVSIYIIVQKQIFLLPFVFRLGQSPFHNKNVNLWGQWMRKNLVFSFWIRIKNEHARTLLHSYTHTQSSLLREWSIKCVPLISLFKRQIYDAQFSSYRLKRALQMDTKMKKMENRTSWNMMFDSKIQ